MWLTAQPSSVLIRSELTGTEPLCAATGDFDLDTVEDALDNCPLEPNPPPQADSGSVGVGPADGVGDVCQCGDVDGDGIVLAADASALQAEFAGTASLAFPAKCEVSGDGLCNLLDLVRVRRALASLGPGLEQACAPATL